MEIISKTEFLKMPILEQLKYCIKESLQEHKKFTSEYWKGSAYMGNNILKTIDQLDEIANNNQNN